MVGADATSLTFRCEGAGLAARVALHPQHMQSLHLQLTPLPDLKDQWPEDDLKVHRRWLRYQLPSPKLVVYHLKAEYLLHVI